MNATVKEVMQFIKENDVKFIRLAFCDLFGAQKNISTMPEELEAVFAEGISFDASAIRGFSDVTKSDLLLFPDPSTLSVLPWRPQQGRVARFYCDIKYPDGTLFECDSRAILKNVLAKCEKMGYVCKVGSECEFYLFKTDSSGNPMLEPLDNAGYLDVSPLDKGENVRREICLTLADMGLQPECSHHEQGPGQNEVDFKFSDAMSGADNIMTFKTVVKVLASRNGLFASFMPKPLLDKAGNGMHINLSLAEDGYNIFKNGKIEQNKVVEGFIAGILEKAREMTAFLNPIANSYERFGGFEAPKYISWSHQNRSQLIRIPAAKGEKTRMELRSPDTASNPYLALALIIGAGLYGVENGLKLPPPVNKNLFDVETVKGLTLDRLPETMSEAIECAKASAFVKSIIGEAAFEKYIKEKEKEAAEYGSASDKEEFYKERYFLKT